MLYCLCTFQDISISHINVSLGAEMALHEERSEQKQRKWLSRLARERQDLSASVEAALLDTASQEQRGQDEVGEQESSVQPAQGTTLIPPRLSLQSRLMTAIQPGSFIEAATRSHSATTPAKMEEEAKESSPSASVQNANVLTRFAQRITTSLAALGSTMHPEVCPPSLIADEEEQQPLEKSNQELSVTPQQVPDVLASNLEWSQEGSTSGRISSFPGVGASSGEVQTVQSKQRLAGRTGKIRLETAVLPTPPHSTEQEQQQLEKRSRATSVDLVVTSAPAGEATATNAHLHDRSSLGEKGVYPEKLVKELSSEVAGRTTGGMIGGVSRGITEEISKGTTSVHLPALDRYKGEVGTAARGALSGCGMVECGQQEIIVANKYITGSSVVLVMLTNDPGPVVVQYISLQPQVGFTIHLTAPAAMKASFNYVVLLGELF